MSEEIERALRRVDEPIRQAVLFACSANEWLTKWGAGSARAQALQRDLLAYCSHRLGVDTSSIAAEELRHVAERVDRLPLGRARVNGASWRQFYDAYMLTQHLEE